MEDNRQFFFKKWFNIALINFLIVALLGVLMRYKIAFSFPMLQQKNILHAHSHFAFSGWISQALILFMMNYLYKINGHLPAKYKYIIWANLFASYGMLCSFPFQGYGPVSIVFSTLSIFVMYVFTVLYWKDLNKYANNSIESYWFKAALVFSTISSFGAFSLAYMMATKTAHATGYLASIYYYLHFQYNGWFQFAILGLFFYFLSGVNINPGKQKIIFWLFAASCIPACFLSMLWLPLPNWSYFIVALSAIAQFAGLLLLSKLIYQNRSAILIKAGKPVAIILLLSFVAFSIKILLQLGSSIPELSKLAFGFRPIVIGYLHLVLLGMVALFIIGYARSLGYLKENRASWMGTYLLISGIVINELLLMVQGIAAIGSTSVGFINELLFGAAIILFAGISWLNMGQAREEGRKVKK